MKSDIKTHSMKKALPALALCISMASMACQQVSAQNTPTGPTPGTTTAPSQPQPQPQPQDQDQDQDGRMAKMSEIQTRLNRITQKIAVTQQAAMKKPEVQQEQVVYSQLLDKKVVEKEPSMQDAIQKEKALVQELQTSPELQMPAEQRNEEIQEKLDSYRALQQSLSAKREAAAQSGEATAQRQKVEDVLIAAMTDLEPETPNLLEERQTLSQQLQQLQR